MVKKGSKIHIGQTSNLDDKHSGHPTTEKTMAKIHNAVLDDWQLKVHKLADIAMISVDCAHIC